MDAVTICSDFGAPKIKSVTVSTLSPSICHEVTVGTEQISSFISHEMMCLHDRHCLFFLPWDSFSSESGFVPTVQLCDFHRSHPNDGQSWLAPKWTPDPSWANQSPFLRSFTCVDPGHLDGLSAMAKPRAEKLRSWEWPYFLPHGENLSYQREKKHANKFF